MSLKVRLKSICIYCPNNQEAKIKPTKISSATTLFRTRTFNIVVHSVALHCIAYKKSKLHKRILFYSGVKK